MSTSPETPCPTSEISHCMPAKEEGIKYDDDKLPIQLIPPESIVAQAEILAFGARKYSERNWEKGMRWSRLFGAINRHLWTWWSGDCLDRETLLNHIKAVHTVSGFLVTYIERNIGIDDRPPGVNSGIWHHFPSIVQLWKDLEKGTP